MHLCWQSEGGPILFSARWNYMFSTHVEKRADGKFTYTLED